MLLYLKFVCNFVQDSLVLILPINIAIAYHNVIPLKEYDAIMVCLFYSCIGLMATMMHYLTGRSSIQKCERLLLLCSIVLTLVGLVLQLQYFNGMSLVVSLGGLILSFVAIEIMDGAVISLTSIFVPVEFLANSGLMNVSFLHVFVGTLGRSLGCIAIYLPAVFHIYQSYKSESDLIHARRLAILI